MRRIARERRGVAMIEYALLVALIALGVLSAVQAVGTSNIAVWNAIGDGLRGSEAVQPVVARPIAIKAVVAKSERAQAN